MAARFQHRTSDLTGGASAHERFPGVLGNVFSGRAARRDPRGGRIVLEGYFPVLL